MNKGINAIILCLLLLISPILYAASTDGMFVKKDQANNLRLGNDYVVIVVNQDQNAQGRFAIETTGGAPFRDNDNNKPLVYGRPKPWTSYTTVQIDGENYVFGGKTERRAGRDGKYGDVISPPEVINNSIHTTGQIDGLKVEQILTIVKSSTTGLYDSVQIKYRVKNTTETAKKVGLRIMLDTMLGKNDGAPFRLGKEAVTTDNLYLKDELPNFWQAFDSISSPTVTSQGNFKGPGVTVPDKVYFSDWGSLADGVWDFDFNPGQEFIRKGEFETDSAIALLWSPDTLSAGETKTFVTTYGLGGITIVPGLISLGVTSPAEVTFDKQNRSFPVIAYIENTSEIVAKDVKVTINLPDGFTTSHSIKSLGNFKPGDIAQVIWNVKPKTNNIPQNIEYSVKVSAENTDSNQVKRDVKFVGPPHIETKIGVINDLKVDLGQLKPNPFTVQASVTNNGGSILYDTSINLALPPGLILAPKEVSKKYLGFIKNGETVKVNWEVEALNIEGKLPFAVNVKGLNDYSANDVKNIDIPELKPLVYLSSKNSLKDKQVGDYFTVDLKGENIQNINQLNLILDYNPDFIKPVYIYPGNIFVKGDKVVLWDRPNISDKGNITFKEKLPANKRRGTIGSIQFKILKKYDFSIKWNKIIGLDDNNNEIQIETKNLLGGNNNE